MQLILLKVKLLYSGDNGKSHNNTQPSIGVYKWHRIE